MWWKKKVALYLIKITLPLINIDSIEINYWNLKVFSSMTKNEINGRLFSRGTMWYIRAIVRYVCQLISGSNKRDEQRDCNSVREKYRKTRSPLNSCFLAVSLQAPTRTTQWREMTSLRALGWAKRFATPEL